MLLVIGFLNDQLSRIPPPLLALVYRIFILLLAYILVDKKFISIVFYSLFLWLPLPPEFLNVLD